MITKANNGWQLVCHHATKDLKGEGLQYSNLLLLLCLQLVPDEQFSQSVITTFYVAGMSSFFIAFSVT
jgi:hypothetical protein